MLLHTFMSLPVILMQSFHYFWISILGMMMGNAVCVQIFKAPEWQVPTEHSTSPQSSIPSDDQSTQFHTLLFRCILLYCKLSAVCHLPEVHDWPWTCDVIQTSWRYLKYSVRQWDKYSCGIVSVPLFILVHISYYICLLSAIMKWP
jgi:hypothetical protein